MRVTLFTLRLYGITAVPATAGAAVSPAAGGRTLRRIPHLRTRLQPGGLRVILGARIVTEGHEHLPESGRPALIGSRHQSGPDSIPLPDRHPLVERILRRLGCIRAPVDGLPAARRAMLVEGLRRSIPTPC